MSYTVKHAAGPRLRANSEAMLLVALLDGGKPRAHHHYIYEKMSPADFSNGLYGQLFEVLQQRHHAQEPNDFVSINNQLLSAGKAKSVLHGVVLDLVGLNADPTLIPHYAQLVVNLWYRRQFQRCADTMQQLADEGDNEDLFPQMRVLGIEQQKAWKRWRAFRHGLHVKPDKDTTTERRAAP